METYLSVGLGFDRPTVRIIFRSEGVTRTRSQEFDDEPTGLFNDFYIVNPVRVF